MQPTEIVTLRRALGLSQAEFGQLFDAHPMTVSKWERGLLRPSAYQIALMRQFEQTVAAKREATKEQVKNLLVSAGVVAALIWLLGARG
jgi:transcriptional regulator with XRE-family HTH domain